MQTLKAILKSDVAGAVFILCALLGDSVTEFYLDHLPFNTIDIESDDDEIVISVHFTF